MEGKSSLSPFLSLDFSQFEKFYSQNEKSQRKDWKDEDIEKDGFKAVAKKDQFMERIHSPSGWKDIGHFLHTRGK